MATQVPCTEMTRFELDAHFLLNHPTMPVAKVRAVHRKVLERLLQIDEQKQINADKLAAATLSATTVRNGSFGKGVSGEELDKKYKEALDKAKKEFDEREAAADEDAKPWFQEILRTETEEDILPPYKQMSRSELNDTFLSKNPHWPANKIRNVDRNVLERILEIQFLKEAEQEKIAALVQAAEVKFDEGIDQGGDREVLRAELLATKVPAWEDYEQRAMGYDRELSQLIEEIKKETTPVPYTEMTRLELDVTFQLKFPHVPVDKVRAVDRDVLERLLKVTQVKQANTAALVAAKKAEEAERERGVAQGVTLEMLDAGSKSTLTPA